MKKKFLMAAAILSVSAVVAGCTNNDVPAEPQNVVEEPQDQQEEPTEETEATEETGDSAEEASGVDVIAGTWYETDVLDSRTLTVNNDGSYELAYRGGGAAYGTVSVETDDNGAVKYCFYEEDGTLWAAFDCNERVSDLYSEDDGGLHFVGSEYVDENEDSFDTLNDFEDAEFLHETSEGVDAEAYEGMWACDRCSITIEDAGNGEYSVYITWANSAEECAEWLYTCTYDEYTATLVCDGTGTLSNVVYKDDGTEDYTDVYTDGTAAFIMREGTLTWLDMKENAGDGMVFMP